MEVLVADASEVINSTKKKTKHDREKQFQKAHVHAHHCTRVKKDAPRRPCPICSKAFQRMDAGSRLEATEKAKLCKICLYNHGKWKCRSKIRCDVDNCRDLHNPLLHQAKSWDGARRTVSAVCNAHGHVRKSSLYKIIPVTLHNGQRTLDIFAFLDDGSSSTFIEASVAKELGLRGMHQPLKLTWTGNVVRKEPSSRQVNFSISARGHQQQFCLKNAHTVKDLSLPRQSMPGSELKARYSHLKDLPIPSYDEVRPKMLIGLEDLDVFKPLELRNGKNGEPAAYRCALGWVVYGSIEGKRTTTTFHGIHSCQQIVDDELNELMHRPVVPKQAVASAAPLSEPVKDIQVRETLVQRTRRIGERFETGLLWESDRTESLESKLAEDPALRQTTFQRTRNYMSKGYTHKASEEELQPTKPDHAWYLSNNAVTHPKKPEKKRLVRDAVAQVEAGTTEEAANRGARLEVSAIHARAGFEVKNSEEVLLALEESADLEKLKIRMDDHDDCIGALEPNSAEKDFIKPQTLISSEPDASKVSTDVESMKRVQSRLESLLFETKNNFFCAACRTGGARSTDHNLMFQCLDDGKTTCGRRCARKVEEVLPGKDGRVRRAARRTSSGQPLLRPVAKLAVFVIRDGDSGKRPHPDSRGGGYYGNTGPAAAPVTNWIVTKRNGTDIGGATAVE